MPWVSYIGKRSLAGDILGPNLISNGHFTDDTTGWTDTSAAGGTVSTTAAGELSLAYATGRPSITQSVVTEAGALYRIEFDATQLDEAVNAFVGTSSGGTQVGVVLAGSVGSISAYLVASASTTHLRLNGPTSAGTNKFDNVKVRKVITRGHATDIEHVTNGDFAADAQWTKGTGWTIGIGVATATAGTASNLSQDAAIGLRRGKVYDTAFTLGGSVAGSHILYVGEVNAAYGGTSRTSAGTYTEQITAGRDQTGGLLLLVRKDATGAGTVDNVSVKLAANNTWSLDFDIGTLSPARAQNRNSVQMLDGSTDTLYWSSKKTLQVQTTILDYGAWQFMEEFIDNATDGQVVTFDPYGTESQPKQPGSYILVDAGLNHVFGADTTEHRSYSLSFREV